MTNQEFIARLRHVYERAARPEGVTLHVCDGANIIDHAEALVEHAETCSFADFKTLSEERDTLEEKYTELVEGHDSALERLAEVEEQLKEALKPTERVERLETLGDDVRDLLRDIDCGYPNPTPLFPIREHLRALGHNCEFRID